MMLLALSTVTRSLTATAANGGNSPPFCEQTQHKLNQARNCLSESKINLGSSTASSYARHQRLIPPPTAAHSRGSIQEGATIGQPWPPRHSEGRLVHG